MPNDTQSRPMIRIRGRSYMAFVVLPEAPLDGWLAELDAQLRRSPGFFKGRPVVVDLGLLRGDEPGAARLMDDIQSRGLRVIDVENAGSVPGTVAYHGGLSGGRDTGEVAAAQPASAAAEETSLIVREPIRSGQFVMFGRGDVTVLGAVSSGAEVLAGGSVHVYGPLRGRAIAGATGVKGARIFCQRMEAELVSIDGFYKTAEDMDPAMRGNPVQVWLDGDMIRMSVLR